MVILGLDASTVCTGWAIVETSDGTTIKIIDFGELDLSKFKKKAFPLKYVLVLFEFVLDLCRKYKPDRVYIEDVFCGRNVITYKALSRMRGVCESAILFAGYTAIKAVGTLDLRRNVLGTSKFDKNEVCAIIEKKYNITLATSGYDASDATLVAIGGALDATNQITFKPRKRKPRTFKSDNDRRSKARRKSRT